MALTVSNEGNESTFEILDEGTHAAVCTWIVDIGPQEVEWQGEKKIQNKVKLRFEVPAERVKWTDKDGADHEGPKVIWATYTSSLAEKAKLRAHLESWRGRAFTDEELMGFDLKNVLGKPCMLSVIHRQANGKTYANITGISKLMKGLAVSAEGETFAFDFDNHTATDLAKLPEWLQKIVRAGQELQAARTAHKPAPAVEDDFVDSDIPF